MNDVVEGDQPGSTAGQLPLLAQTRTAVAEVDPEAEDALQRLDILAMLDPALAVRWFRACRKPHGGFLAAAPDTHTQALRLLGVRKAHQLALSTTTSAGLSSSVRAGYERCMAHAWLAACLAGDWATVDGARDHATLAIAALLHRVGELALWNAGDGALQEIRHLRDEQGLPPDEAQYAGLGRSLAEITLTLASEWQLPALVGQALIPENARHPHALLVMLANHIADVLVGTGGALCSAEVHSLGELLRQDPESLAARLAALYTHCRAHPWHGGHLWPVSGTRETAHPETASVCLLPADASYQAGCLWLEEAVGAGADEIVQKTLRILHDGLGLNRVVFARYLAAMPSLRAWQLVGTEHDPRFNLFELPLAQPHLFTELMERPHALWIDADKDSGRWRSVPDEIRHLIGVRAFFSLSVFVAGEPFGLFYADRRFPACALDAASFERFAHIGRLAQAALDGVVEGGRSDHRGR